MSIENPFNNASQESEAEKAEEAKKKMQRENDEYTLFVENLRKQGKEFVSLEEWRKNKEELKDMGSRSAI